MIKVLVVDDSALMRSEITKMIESDPDIKVVGTAKDGTQVMERVKELAPDVLTMDIEMPKMNGLDALKLVMAEAPRPVIMVSALTDEGAEETITALENGAFDFIHKPSGSISLDIATQTRLLVEKIKAAGKSKTSAVRPIKPGVKQPAAPDPKSNESTLTRQMPGKLEASKIIGLGISTGGPNTLMKILPLIPNSLNATILLVQHMPEKFTATLAKRLNTLCPMTVKEAQDGEILERACIYIAPGNRHMSVTARNPKLRFIKIQEGVSGDINRPSVDVLFHSLCDNFGKNWLGVLLTGMGGDGADGLLRLRKMGGHTIVEAEETCVVFGMPKRAIEKGAAEFILPNLKVPEKIVELYNKQGF